MGRVVWDIIEGASEAWIVSVLSSQVIRGPGLVVLELAHWYRCKGC